MRKIFKKRVFADFARDENIFIYHQENNKAFKMRKIYQGNKCLKKTSLSRIITIFTESFIFRPSNMHTLYRYVPSFYSIINSELLV